MKRRLSLYFLLILLPLLLITGSVYCGWYYAGGGAGGVPCSGTYGQTSHTLGAYAWSANYRCYITPVTTDCSETSGSICAWLNQVNTTNQRVTLVLYDDDGGSGEPSTLLDSYEIDDTFSSAEAHCEAFTATISAGNYWVGACAESTVSYYGLEATTGGDGRYYTPGSYSVPSPWPHESDTTSAYDRTFYLSF